MGSKLSLGAVWRIAKSEFVKCIMNPRIIIVGVMLIFIRTLVAIPLLERAEKFGENLNALEPFIAVGNSGMMVMLMPAVFLVLISDFPVISGNSLFFIMRTGKVNWFFGQMLFIILSIGVYISFVLIASILFSGGGFFGTNWSDTVTKYNAMFPAEAQNFASELLRPNLYNQMSVISALLHTIALLTLYLFLLSLVLGLFKMLYLKIAGIFAVYTIIALGVVTTSLTAPLMWVFPMANTIVWLHYDEILRKPITPVVNSYIYFFVLIFVLIALNMLVLKKIQFVNIEQEGV